MLILTRKKEDSIVIGDDVIVTVKRISEDSVRLGICCPFDRNIRRLSPEESLAWRLNKLMAGGTWAAPRQKQNPIMPADVETLRSDRHPMTFPIANAFHQAVAASRKEVSPC